MSSEPNATPDQLPIDDQLIALVRVARALGYYDAAEWISRRAMAQAKKVAEVGEPACGAPYELNANGICGAPQRSWRHNPCDDVCERAAAENDGVPFYCGHHAFVPLRSNDGDAVPVSALPPASEPSRTDAVREAIAQDELHKNCAAGCAIAEGPRFHYKRIAVVDECGNVRLRRPLVVDFADAERKLVTAAYESNQIRDDIMETLSTKLAASEKRAKDAEARANTLTRLCEEGQGYVKDHSDQITALTRKLAIATDALRNIWHNGWGTTDRAWARDALAAIDAPAGEEGTKCDLCGHELHIGMACLVLDRSLPGSCCNCVGAAPPSLPSEPANALRIDEFGPIPTDVDRGSTLPNRVETFRVGTSEPANAQVEQMHASILSTTALTFEEWGRSIGNPPGQGIARHGWDARQPEIDALREREQRLREYVTHKPECELIWYCSACRSHRDAHPLGAADRSHDFQSMADANPTQPGCTCKLAELLAAKEGV